MPSALSDVAAREAYHVILLEYLLERLGPRLILKGGVNLRLYFGSPRYSQDIDFDAEPQARDAVRAAIRAGFADAKVRRRAADLGVGSIEAPTQPQKDSETTLRFKFLLVGTGGIERNTKIEVSFRPRPPLDRATLEPAPPERVDPYRERPQRQQATGRRRRGAIESAPSDAASDTLEPPPLPSLLVPHYGRVPALRQKIGALALRNEVQARDIFDLGVLGDSTAATISEEDAAELRQALPDSILQKAADRAFEIPYEEYRDKVLDFLDAADRERFEGRGIWDEQCLRAHELAQHLLSLKGPAWVPWYPDEPRPEMLATPETTTETTAEASPETVTAERHRLERVATDVTTP